MLVPKSIAVVLALYSGFAIIIQNGVNANLNMHGIPNPFATAGVSYAVGLLTIGIISVIDRPPCCSSDNRSHHKHISIKSAPWYAFMGGPLGAVYVTSAILVAPRLGFATFQLAVTFGQLTSSMICDAVGFLHLPITHTTPWRVSCLILLALGTALSANWTTTSQNDQDDNDVFDNATTTASPWWKLVYAVGATVAGSLFPIQSCVNFEMVHHVGTPYRAVVVSFTGGVTAVWLLTGFSYLISETTRSQGSVFSHANDTPPWMWLGGGVLGATFITSAVIGLPSLGAVAFTGIFISTQLVVATTFDALGAFGFDPVPIFMGGGRRVVGVSCAVIAAAAFQMPRPPHKWLESWPWSETEEWEGERKPLVQVIRDSAEEEEEEDDTSVSLSSSSSLRMSLRMSN